MRYENLRIGINMQCVYIRKAKQSWDERNERMTESKKIRVGIVDDKYFIAKSIEEKLSQFEEVSVDFISEGATPMVQFLVGGGHLDLILMDIEMPGINGIELTHRISNKYPTIKIVMLTVFDNSESIFRAIKAGASGYLLKDTPAKELLRAIKETLTGGAPMSPSIAYKTLQLLKNPTPVKKLDAEASYSLSKREIEVLELLSMGKTYNSIAQSLFLSVGTIRKHVENIYKKLKVHNKIEALKKARENRLI